MAAPKSPFFKVLLTTTLCVALTACGGEMPVQSGYNDDAMERTHNFSATAERSALQKRLDALEQTIMELRADYQRIASTYTGLVTTNERINELLSQLEEERTQPVSMPVPVTPVQEVPIVAEEPESARLDIEPTKKYNHPTVTGVRIGEHKDKTRLVIDSSSSIKMATDLDNNEKILLVTFSGDWAAKESVSGLSSPRIKGWSVQGGGDNKVLAIELKKQVVLAGTETLKAAKNNSARFVIDLK